MKIEIRWHGRGGQGAKTVSQLLAEAALEVGNFVQAFPQYGPERSGAPMSAFNRISPEKIRIHYHIYEPDVVVVLDSSLLDSDEANVTQGLKKEGVLLVNTEESPSKLRGKTGFQGKIATVPATKIAHETGSRFANIPTLGALAKIIDLPLEKIEEKLKEMFSKKKSGIIDSSLKALRKGFESVEVVEVNN
jgi:pyruvate ferredoxin oxidoreductase gamma subunit